MIVWSKGLGKQRLLVELPKTELGRDAEYLRMDGEIESVGWKYTIRLTPTDMGDFLHQMRKPESARFLARHGGLILPLAGGLLRQLPYLLWLILKHRILRIKAKEDRNALLV
jgi:hypothetical protein